MTIYLLPQAVGEYLSRKVSLVPIVISGLGIDFIYQGENITYLWPWRRSAKRRKWLSFAFEGTFESLASLDQEWRAYFAACQKCDEQSSELS